MAKGEFRVFISAVSSEFETTRDEIAADLGAKGILVRVQSSFRLETGADTLLRKLHNYIRDCDAIICLVGKRTGARPPPGAAAVFREMLPPTFESASYTQWEFFFARHYRKRLSIYVANDDHVPDQPAPTAEDFPELQSALVHYIRHEQGLDRGRFSNAEQLCRAILKEDWPTKEWVKPINLPYPTIGDLFKGRAVLMQRLARSLTFTHRAAIIAGALYGLGGIGKTRAAVEYAWENEGKYSAILLVTAQTPETLRRDLAELTILLGLPEQESKDDEVKLRATLTWLRLNPVWLLILDGLDTIPALEEACRLMGRMTGGHVVITSKLTNFPPHVEPIALDVLATDDAAQFLIARTEHRRRLTIDDANRARELAEALDGLALALEHAAAFISERRLTFSEYLDQLNKNWDSTTGWSNRAIAPHALAAAWQTSVDRLSVDALQLLQRLAWFSSEPVPEFILDVPIAGVDQTSLSESLDELSSFSLATRRPEHPFFSVHRVVQDVTRHNLRTQYRQSLEEAVRWMDAAFTGDPADVDNWARLDPLWPHALTIVKHAQQHEIGSAARLMNAVGLLLTTKTNHAQREIELGFSPRVWLPAVKQLRFSHARFEKALEPLGGLANLEELTLNGVYVGDAAPLTKWVNLQRLDLGRTKVISVAPLAKLKALRKLDLRRTKITEIAPIAALKDLQNLSLAHCSVTDISPLASLAKLQSLDLSDTQVNDIIKLGALLDLTHLRLGGTRVRELLALSALTKLRVLDLSDTKVSDVAPLAKLRNLEELRLNGTRVRDVSALARLTSLRDLDLSGSRVRELSALSKLVNLQVLSLGGCTIENAAPLAGLINLQVLNLGCTRIADVTPLASLTKLRYLDLRGTRVQDLRPLSKLFGLQSVDLAYTHVTDVSTLASLPCLEFLHLEGSWATDVERLFPVSRVKIMREI